MELKCPHANNMSMSALARCCCFLSVFPPRFVFYGWGGGDGPGGLLAASARVRRARRLVAAARRLKYLKLFHLYCAHFYLATVNSCCRMIRKLLPVLKIQFVYLPLPLSFSHTYMATCNMSDSPHYTPFFLHLLPRFSVSSH